MDLASWTNERTDRARMQRLGIGYAIGAALVLIMVLVVMRVASAASAESEPEEPAREVTFASAPVPTQNEAPRRADPTPAAPEPQIARPAGPPPAPKLRAPLAVPTAPARESDPTGTAPDPYDDTSGAAETPPDTNGAGSGSEGGPAAPPPPPPPAVATPRVAAPVRVTQDVTPPKPIAMAPPSYPAAARAAGIEGTVIVRYVVTTSGEVTSVAAVHGPEELREACVRAVQAWRFEPALSEGRPVAVERTARFPFRIKT